MDDRPIVYFNNCRNRDHVAIFGSGAFFDLGTKGRQGAQARDLRPGQICVVAESAPDNRIAFDWYSFRYEALLSDENNLLDRVFFGSLMVSERLPKPKAAKSDRYSALFKSNGNLKNGSVFRKSVPSIQIPPQSIEDAPDSASEPTDSKAGAGFGDPAENKAVEAAAIREVVSVYKQDGWSIRSVERDKCGFDLECSRKGVVENVEVKGVRADQPCFIITAGEVAQARKNAKFVLMVVTSALSMSPNLFKYSGKDFSKRFELSAIQYRAVLKP